MISFSWTLIIFTLNCAVVLSHKGYFWQVTDFHYDVQYSQQGEPHNMCHQDSSRKRDTGEYGNYLCDSPWKLVKSAVAAMKEIQPQPDFILWTGDSIPHVPLDEINDTVIFSSIKNLTNLLTATFPNVTIYPVIGNHDYKPTNQIPEVAKKYYSSLLSDSNWISLCFRNTPHMVETFLKGGYYSGYIPTSKVKVIALNSVLWYNMDRETADLPDPAEQFDWLENELKECRKKQEKAILIGHVPPGVLARANLSWFYPNYNHRYVSLAQNYADAISQHIFGHEHTDSFHLFYDKQKVAVGIAYMTPAVTPWYSSIPGIGSNNPAVRLYEYDRTTGNIEDVFQYYLNLSATNRNHRATWMLEYRMKDVFKLDNLTPKLLDNLVDRMQNESKTEFEDFYEFNSVKFDQNHSTEFQRKHFICSIKNVDYDEFELCMTGLQNGVLPRLPDFLLTSPVEDELGYRHHHHHHKPHHPKRDVPEHMYIIIGVLVVVVVILFFIVTLLCLYRRPAMSYPRYVLIS